MITDYKEKDANETSPHIALYNSIFYFIFPGYYYLSSRAHSHYYLCPRVHLIIKGLSELVNERMNNAHTRVFYSCAYNILLSSYYNPGQNTIIFICARDALIIEL